MGPKPPRSAEPALLSEYGTGGRHTGLPEAIGCHAKAVLAGIAGVGPAKQDALLAHYGSLDAIRAASIEDIVANVKGFGTALATRVKDERS